jgi:hypothetical protein
VHSPSEEHIHRILTNHHYITNDPKVEKVGEVLQAKQSIQNLRFYSQVQATFKAQNGQQKAVWVTVWNQNYLCESSFESMYRGGLKGFFEEGVVATIFSLKFMGTFLFFVMIAILFVGGMYCPGINDERREIIDRLKRQHELEIELGERNDTFVEPPLFGTWETACYY